METKIFFTIMMILVFWILIQDPIKYIFGNSKFDYIFYIISFILFGIFSIELIVECWI